jgi:hypothetical protein
MESKAIILSKRISRKLIQTVGVGASQPILAPATIPKQTIRNSLSTLSKIYMGHCADDHDVKQTASHIRTKLKGYMAQDTAMDRDASCNATFEETVHMLIASGLKCHYCERLMGMGAEENDTNIQWTLDRIDNSLPHTDKNTVVACLGCNLKRGNVAYDAFVKNSNGYFSTCKKLKPRSCKTI